MGDGFLKSDAVEQLRAEFPDITKPGFLTVDDVEVRGRFNNSSTNWKARN